MPPFCTVKKENQISTYMRKFSSCKVIYSMRKGFLKYEEMRKHWTIYEEAVSHIWLCNCSILNFHTYEEHFIFFFICVLDIAPCMGTSTYMKTQLKWLLPFLSDLLLLAEKWDEANGGRIGRIERPSWIKWWNTVGESAGWRGCLL